MSDPIFHLALPEDWAAAQEAGAYTTSTRGVTLEQEGFIHCSRADQWEGTRERFYGDVDELLLLTVDPARLTSELRVDPVGEDTFPHVYGPIDLAAVVDVRALTRD